MHAALGRGWREVGTVWRRWPVDVPGQGVGMTADSTEHPRPRWSLSEAARRCNVGRATLQRRIEAGLLPGATKTDNGWSIGVEDLLAAGLHPGRGTPPVEQPTLGREHARVTDLERDLAVERTKRAAAEQLAADRAEHITDLRRSLLMLEAGRGVQEAGTSRAGVEPEQRNATSGAALTLVADPQPSPATGGQGWWRRWSRAAN